MVSMMTVEEQSFELRKLAEKYKGDQVERYKNSIFLPYVSLPNVKGKGTMMEDFFCQFLDRAGLKVHWEKSPANYDFLINGHLRVELKVASIGAGDAVRFNQIHFGADRQVDKFLFTVLKPDDTIDFFIIPKEDFQVGKIKVKQQHNKNISVCASINMPYPAFLEKFAEYKVEVDNLAKYLI